MAHIDPILMDILTSKDKGEGVPQIRLSFNELLIKATYHNNFELVQRLINQEEFDKSIINDIGLLNKPFPLYYITMCYKKAMWGEFRDEIMPFIEEQRKNIDKLMVLWEDTFCIDPDSHIDYKMYEEYFYCISDEETDEGVFLDPRKKFTDNGCLNIDLDLFVAVDKFQFAKVKELLEKGANPNANLVSIDDIGKDYVDPRNCIDRIGFECSYLCSHKVFPIIKNAHGTWYVNYAMTDREIGNLIGWAAHEEMYNLLNQYYKPKTEESSDIIK